MSIRHLIGMLNGLGVGEFETLARRLADVRRQAAELGLSEVSAILDEAQANLAACDLKAFRKKVQHAVSRLGHVPDPATSSRPA